MPEENVSGHMQTGGKLMWQNKGVKLELPRISDQELPERLDGHAILVRFKNRMHAYILISWEIFCARHRKAQALNLRIAVSLAFDRPSILLLYI